MQTESQFKNRTPGRVALTVLNVILYLILGLLIIFNITVIVQNLLLPDRPPDLFNVLPMVVETEIMEGDEKGCLQPGDLVFVQTTGFESLSVGDVVVYRSEYDMLLLGRVRSAEGGAFVIKGDRLAFSYDEPMTAENYYGRIGFRIPLFGRVANFLLSPLGLVLFLIIPLVICLCLIVIDLARRRLRRRKERMEAVFQEYIDVKAARAAEAAANAEENPEARANQKTSWWSASLLMASLAAFAIGLAKGTSGKSSRFSFSSRGRSAKQKRSSKKGIFTVSAAGYKTATANITTRTLVAGGDSQKKFK